MAANKWSMEICFSYVVNIDSNRINRVIKMVLDKMIGVLIIESTFMVLILIAVFAFALQTKKWAIYREQQQQKRFEEFREDMKKTQTIIKSEVKQLIAGVNKIISNGLSDKRCN